MDQNDTYGENDHLVNVIKFLIQSGENIVAENLLDVFARNASNIEQFNCLTKLYFELRIYEKAEKYALKTLELCDSIQQKYNINSNLAKMYNNFNEPCKSLFYSEQNFLKNPNNPDTILEIMHSHFLNGEKEKAEKLLRELNERDNLSERHKNVINFNLGTFDMQRGHFIKGLAGFLKNIKKLDLWYNSDDELPLLKWDGKIAPGKKILMYMPGGGFGDAFIAISYWIKLKKLGFEPIFCHYDKDIVTLFNRCGYASVNNWKNIDDKQNLVWCFAFDVPIILNMNPEDMLTEHYLWASDEARKKWDWIKDSKKLKVGVRFIGNKKNNKLLYRHIDPDDMMNFLHDTFKGVDVEYYSLQKGDGEEEASERSELINIADQINSFDDTVALIENLDIIISTCTSVVHLGGAIGTKTIVFVPIAAYFTYLTKPKNRPEHTSLWYGDNFRFFMQQKPKVWDEPMKEAKNFIQENLLDD
jgi:tetratricopeptide (TPR) repeat protein